MVWGGGVPVDKLAKESTKDGALFLEVFQVIPNKKGRGDESLLNRKAFAEAHTIRPTRVFNSYGFLKTLGLRTIDSHKRASQVLLWMREGGGGVFSH